MPDRPLAVQPEADQAEREHPLEVQREAEQRRSVGEVIPVDVVHRLVAGEDRAQLEQLVADEAEPVPLVRRQREPDGGGEPAVGLLQDGSARRRKREADHRAVGGVAIYEGLDAARGERQRRRAHHEVAGDERCEPDRDAGHEGERDRRERPGMAAEPPRDPQRDEGAEDEGRLAGEEGEREQPAGHQPGERSRLVAAGEPPEEEERERDAEGVAQDERLVEQERAVERRAERSDDWHRAPEEPRREEIHQQDVRHPEHRLAEADAPESIPGDEPHGGQRVGVEGCLMEDRAPSPPPLPGLQRRPLAHPRRVLVWRVPPEDVPGDDASRPCPAGGHVALGPVKLVLRHGQPRHEPEVQHPHRERERQHRHQRAAATPARDHCPRRASACCAMVRLAWIIVRGGQAGGERRSASLRSATAPSRSPVRCRARPRLL